MAALLVLLLQMRPAENPECRILEWIEALGSEDIGCRALASKNLENLGESARPYLLEAANDPDAEVRARCRALLRGVEFEKGARRLSQVGSSALRPALDPDCAVLYEELARKGDAVALVREDFRSFPYILDEMLSDEAKVVKSSLRALHLILQRRKPVGVASSLCSALDLWLFATARARAEEYAYWTEWLSDPATRDLIVCWGLQRPKAADEDWERLLGDMVESHLDLGSSEGSSLLDRIRTYGEEAYASLIFYLDHEDIAVGRAALELLKSLTGETGRRLTEENKYDLRAEWLAWLKSR